MRIISVANQKGGCGKTTLAVNIAAAMAKAGKETLLIDLDPQAHATFALGYTKEASLKKTSYDIFRAYFDGLEFPIEDAVISDRDRFSFIPSNIMLSTAEINLGNVNGAAAILSRVLKEQFFEKYEYVIVDSPPSFGFLTLNAMYAADMIVVPVDMSYFSFNGINSVYRVAGLLNTETGRRPSIFFAMNIFDKRSKFAGVFEEDARKKLGPYVFSTKIRSSIRIREASRDGKTIFEYLPESSVSADFVSLAEEITVCNMRDIDVAIKEFVLSSPRAGTVYLLGDFNGWQKSEYSRLAQLENGNWAAHLPLKKGRYRYKYLVDDQWIKDPSNPVVEPNSFGTADSVIVV